MRATATIARLLAASALSLTLAAPAQAAVNGLESSDGTPISNPSGTTITGDRKGVYSYGSELDLDNAGTIRGNGTAGSVNDSDGGIIFSGGPGAITNSGSISGQRFGISTIYFNNGGTFEGRAIGSTVDNSGSIIGDTDDGIRLIGGGTVTNSGYIAGRVGVGADGISIFAYNGQNTTGMTSIGSVTNLAGGLIEGNRYGVIIFGPGSIDNAGTIDHTASVQGSPLFGAGQTGIITNSGTIINGSISLAVLDTGTANNSGHTVTIGFAGVGTANVNNSGTVDYFTSFNTVGTANVDNSGSIGDGLIFTKTTSANVTNSGSIVATNTPDVVGTTQDAVYSEAALTLTNTATGSIDGFVSGIRSNGASLTLDNAGTIRGNGDQAFRANSAGGVVLQGGPGFITNSGLISGQQFGITTIYVTNDPVLGLAIGSTVDNSGSIIGDNNDGVRLIGGGSVTNSGNIEGRADGDVFNYNNSVLSADGVSMFAYDGQDPSTFAASVTNAAGGQILGNRFGVIFSNGGTVDNSGLILGYRSGGILIQAQVPGFTGSVNNAEGAQIWGGITFQGLDSASVDNAGAIDGVNATQLVAGVHSWNPLTLNNSATGVIEGSSDGVRSDGPSLTLNNVGTIFGLGTNDDIETAANGGVILSGGPASITNSGSISGAKFGIATVYFTNPDNSITGLTTGTTVNNSGSIIGEGNDGIRLHGGGTVTNSGYIAGRVRVGADGVSILAFDGQDLSGLSSAGIGTVNNLFGGVIEGHREGIIISDGGTVNNAGTINGGYRGAIVLEARDAGRIGTLTNSGTINGVVDFIQLSSASLANSGSILAPAGAAVHGWSFDNYMGPLAITNDATGTIVGGTSGIFSEGASLSLTNAGSIRGNGTSVTPRVADAGILITGGPASITNSGSISGAGFGITTGTFSDFFTNAASSRAIGSTVINTGSIVGDSNDGVRLIGGGTVTNSGLISGRVSGSADGVSMFAFEDQATTAQIGTVNNLFGGLIEGFRFGIIQSGGGTISNAGTINGGTNGAILIQTGFINNKTGAITNSGTINGTTAFVSLTSASLTNSGSMTSAKPALFADLQTGPLSVTNLATGSMTGGTSGIHSQASSFSLTNSGTIRGNGSYDGFDAAPDGGLDIMGGPGTIQNSGTISGQRFGITTAYVLNPSTNLLEGRAIGTTVSNSGNIVGDTDTGVRLIGGGSVTNSGYIAGRIGATADGVWMMAYNTQPLGSFATIGSVTNLAGGVIEGNRRGVTLANGGSVNNAGTISGNAAAIRIVALAGDPGRTGTVTNSGTLNGAVELIGLASATATNSGSVSGYVAFTDDGNASLTNSGTISDAVNDAIRSNSRLTLNNAAGGTITGAATGVYDHGPALTVDNKGTIRGLSDTGIAADGASASITNSGTIRGNYWGFAQLNASASSTIDNSGSIIGDYAQAVYLLGGGSVTNRGQILGSTGIEIYGLGSVSNALGATIQGSAGIFLHGGGSVTNAGSITGDVAFLGGTSSTLTNSGTINGLAVFSGGTTTLSNSGTITSYGGTAVFGVGSLSNSGTINGGAGTAVSMTSGNDTATLLTGSSISGAVDGGNGSDTLRLSGTVPTPTTSQTVGRFLNFETLNVLGGYWTAPGNTGTFTSTTISGGALAVNGTLTSPVAVNAGAMLAGIGTITGATTLNSGGMLAPGGSSLGTLNIAGNVAFNAGSTFSVQTNPNGTSDKLAVTGLVNIASGATIQVLAGIATYAPTTTSYIVLTATGGINGKFDKAVTDYAYYNASVNVQKKGTVTLNITPNGKPLPSAASLTGFGAATAVESLGTTSALYQSVVYQSLTGARQAFDALSGSAYARLDAFMDRDVGNIRLGFDGQDSEAPAVSWSGVNSLAARGANSTMSSRRGALSLFMVGGRYGTRLSSDTIAGDIDTRFLASAAAFKSGRFSALAGVASAWHDVSVARTIAYPGFAERSYARYRARSHRMEVEGAYDLLRGPVSFTPYAGYAHLMLSSPAFGEIGGLSALSFDRENRALNQLRLGARAAAKFQLAGLRFAPHVDAAIERVWGAGDPARTASFAIGDQSFDSGALGFNTRAASVDAGLDVQIGRATLTASYRARLGDQWRDRAAMLRAMLRF